MRTTHGESADAADPEQQLLQESVFPGAAIEPVGHAAQVFGVRRRLGVEQQERDAADVGDPDPRGQPTAAGQVETHLDRLAGLVTQQGEAEAVGVQERIALALPTVVADRLREVAGAVEQTTPVSGTPRSEALLRWSPARMPSPPEYCGSEPSTPNSGEK